MPYDDGVKTAGTIVGAFLAVGGLVWILQGFDVPFAPRSFMTGNREWVFIGAAGVVVGVALVIGSRRGA